MDDRGLLWWRRPRLRDAEEEEAERRATWLELFLDLAFVVVVWVLASGLAAHVTPVGVLDFARLFIPTWWVWVGITIYNDRFETDDVSHRLATFAIIVAVAGLAVYARGVFDGGFAGFALSYAAARLVLIALWLRAGYHEPVARRMTTRYAVGYAVSAALWVAAIWTPWGVRDALVGVALFCDFATPFVTLPAAAGLPRLSASHLPERFGLFVIIVLGQSFAGVVETLAADPSLGMQHVTATVAATLFTFTLWWLYFDHVAESPPHESPLRTLAWGYLHLPLLAALVGVAASAQAFIGNPNSSDYAATWLACGSAGVTFLAIALLEFTREPGAEQVHPLSTALVHTGSAVLAIVVGALTAGTGTERALVGLLVLAIGQVVYGVYTREVHAHRAVGPPPEADEDTA